MPCSDGGPRYDETDTELKNARKTIRTQREKIDLYARLLCFTMTNITVGEKEMLYRLPATEEHGQAGIELKEWWIAHQEIDRKEALRKEKEKKAAAARLAEEGRKAKVKTEALRKLTSEERQLLGLS